MTAPLRNRVSSASPPVLPTTVPSAAPATVLPAAADAAATSIASPDPAAMRAFLGRLYNSAKRSLSGARPWPDLLDRAVLSRPDSLFDTTARLRKNLAYFRVNYAALSLLAHPFSLVALLAFLAAWCFLYLLRPIDAAPLNAFGRTFSDPTDAATPLKEAAASPRPGRSWRGCSLWSGPRGTLSAASSGRATPGAGSGSAAGSPSASPTLASPSSPFATPPAWSR
ncbi:PRA1 family protein B2-like [Triticum dicoccoides]|uniref:PRA1 family protein B2-like n=1 Tax=Triticum dicoccoides TaxID=85692 RepID=UPI00188FC225|nr:PRA1 family protein B2-like [Triticum dicoccoides]